MVVPKYQKTLFPLTRSDSDSDPNCLNIEKSEYILPTIQKNCEGQGNRLLDALTFIIFFHVPGSKIVIS